MNIAIVGAGRVGQAVAKAWVRSGHRVMLSSRDPDGPKAREALSACGAHAALPVAESTAGADVVLIATPWVETQKVLSNLGDLAGKVLIDATNPIVLGADELTRGLLVGHTTSAAELIAQWVPRARVVKAFNTTGAGNLANPVYGERRIPGLLCGDDGEAKRIVAGLAAEVGLDPVDVGALRTARLLEPLALLWVQLALGRGWGPDFAFDLIRRAGH